MFYAERKMISREMLRASPDTLFVFGDNMIERGLGGQAKEMRGEPNAVGIPTKMLPGMEEDCFFRDPDLDRERVGARIEHAFLRLALHMLNGGTVVWPADGIGTGRAQLQTRAPRIWKMIEDNRLILARAGS